MKILRDYREFMEKVDPLHFDDFEGLDIVPTTKLGIFSNDRLDELVRFCKTHHKFHVVSVLSAGIKFNKPYPNVGFYYLAQGDDNPELAFVGLEIWRAYEDLRIFEFLTDEA